jgi:hypothetical protein
MPNLPHTIAIDLRDLVTLVCYYWTAVNSEKIGDLGSNPYEDFMSDLASKCRCQITPEQLESLVYHMKQVIFEKKTAKPIQMKQRNYYHFMRHLKSEIPQLFKELPSGEIVFINFEDREFKDNGERNT